MGIIFKQLMITDVINKVSKKITFSSNINLITSVNNSMGKSVIMKSLYHSLGANCDFDDVFPKENVLFDITLQYKENIYRICRFKNSFRLFKNGEFFKSVKSGNINELSVFFKDELDTYVYLKNRAKTTELAPPAFLFVPYYLDQDLSWKKEQFPFNNMGQYESISRNELYYYHLGVFTVEYNQNKSKQLSIKKQIDELVEKAKKEYNIISELKKSLGNEVIAVNETEFQAIILSFSSKMNELLTSLDRKRKFISRLEKEKIEYIIEEKRILSTIKKIKENKIEVVKKMVCPVCKSEFEFDLEKELGEIYNVNILNLRLNAISKLIEEIEEREFYENKFIEKIQEEINEYEKEIFKNRNLLKEYLNREATEKLLEQKSFEAAKSTDQINKLKDELSKLRERTREFKKQTDRINKSFIENYKMELYVLKAPEFKTNAIKPFYKAKISGSQYVRSTLAFYFAFLKTKEENGYRNFLFPMVIDSPREGEQDDLNSSVILNFILNNKIPNYQLIVASVNAQKYIKIPEGINLISLDGNLRRVMNKEEYEQNIEEITEIFSFFKRQI